MHQKFLNYNSNTFIFPIAETGKNYMKIDKVDT